MVFEDHRWEFYSSALCNFWLFSWMVDELVASTVDRQSGEKERLVELLRESLVRARVERWNGNSLQVCCTSLSVPSSLCLSVVHLCVYAFHEFSLFRLSLYVEILNVLRWPTATVSRFSLCYDWEDHGKLLMRMSICSNQRRAISHLETAHAFFWSEVCSKLPRQKHFPISIFESQITVILLSA